MKEKYFDTMGFILQFFELQLYFNVRFYLFSFTNYTDNKFLAPEILEFCEIVNVWILQ